MSAKLELIKKLLRQADSEESLGNFGAAELFRDKAAALAQGLGLQVSEIDYAFVDEGAKILNELGSTPIMNIFARINARTSQRKIWFEELAKVVGEGYGCRVSPNLENGSVTFFGYDLDRELATFMFVKFAEVAEELRKREMLLLKSRVGKPSFFDFKTKKKMENPKEWMGDDDFTDNFHAGFRSEIEKYLASREIEESKKKEVDAYFDANKDDVSYRYYYYSYRNANLQQSPHNQMAFDIGKICGFNVSHRASKNPSALTVKKSVITEEDTVFILIDTSISMRWGYGEVDKMKQAKDGTLEYARTAIGKKYKVGVMEFADRPRLILPPQDKIDENFQNAVESLRPSGGTNLTDAIRLAQSKLLGRSKRAIMVVTDGQPNNPESALQAANDCKRIGIQILAIGTDDADQDFLNKLTSPGCGLLVDQTRLMLGMGEMAQKLA